MDSKQRSWFFMLYLTDSYGAVGFWPTGAEEAHATASDNDSFGIERVEGACCQS